MRTPAEIQALLDDDPCSCNSPDRSSTHTRGDESWCRDYIELGAAKGMFEYRQALRDCIGIIGDLEQKLAETEKAA